MNENLANNLVSTASERPGGVALTLGGEEMTYAALDEASARVTRLLRERGVGIRSGPAWPPRRVAQVAPA